MLNPVGCNQLSYVDVGTWFIVSRVIWITTCQLSWMTLRNIIHKDPKLVKYNITLLWSLKHGRTLYTPCYMIHLHSLLYVCCLFVFQRMSCTPWRAQCPCCGAVGSMLLWPSSCSHNSSISSTCGSSTSWWQTKSRACAATTGGLSSGSSSVTLRLGQRSRAWSSLLTATSVGLYK